jgi:hypothetical protein
MLRFYWSLLRDIPSVFRSKFEAWAFWVWSVAFPLVILLAPTWKSSVEALDFSRWFALLPIGLWTAYVVLRVNFKRFQLLESERTAWQAQQTPQLAIEFAPTDESDSRPYLQTMTFGMHPGPGQVMREMRDRRYRVGVRNLSAVTIPGVSLRLAKCQPTGNFVFPEHELAVQDTDPPAGSVDVPPSGMRWFDVVNELGPCAGPPDHFRFCYRNPNFSHLPVPPGRYELTLRADSRGVSVERRFVVAKDCEGPQTFGRLRMEPC